MFNIRFVATVLLLLSLFFIVSCRQDKHRSSGELIQYNPPIPNVNSIPSGFTGDEIRYGRELFSRTAYYLGPDGVVMQLCGNKMNCKNCHLDVGTRPLSNNLLETYLKYPQYRAREGMVLTIEDRINNCFERPMNGKFLPYDSREMRAIVSYMRWLCEGRVANYGEDTMHLVASIMITFSEATALPK